MSRIYLRLLAAALSVAGCGTPNAMSPQSAGPAPAELKRLVEERGSLRVVVTLAGDPMPATPEAVAALQQRLLNALGHTQHRVVHRYGASPLLALDVGRDALEVLLASPLVASITPDTPRRPL